MMKKFELMRPKDEYDQVIQQLELDGNRFYQQFHSAFIDSSCPACGLDGTVSFKKFGFQHKTCDSCKTLFCSPRPGEDLLSIYYNEYDAPRMWTELLVKADFERKRLQYQPRFNQIVSAIKASGGKPGGIALDLGAGSGAFASCLKGTGFFSDVIALDLSFSCVEVCKSKGLTSMVGTIADVEKDSLQLLCMNDLIEHLSNPAAFLKQCFGALRKGGMLSIAAPNGEGFDFKILADKTGNITPPEHLNYFNPSSIAILLERCNFKPIYIETPGKLDVEIILKEKQSGFPLREKNQYIDYLMEQDNGVLEAFQAFLASNKLSSHMLILAVKE